MLGRQLSANTSQWKIIGRKHLPWTRCSTKGKRMDPFPPEGPRIGKRRDAPGPGPTEDRHHNLDIQESPTAAIKENDKQMLPVRTPRHRRLHPTACRRGLVHSMRRPDRNKHTGQPGKAGQRAQRHSRGTCLAHSQRSCPGDALWLHQANALNELEDGNNIVVATRRHQANPSSSNSGPCTGWHPKRKEPPRWSFTPPRPLANDQARRWQECCQAIGLDPNTVGQVDGDVPKPQRYVVMKQSRIILATPDICHSWMLPRVNEKSSRTSWHSCRSSSSTRPTPTNRYSAATPPTSSAG